MVTMATARRFQKHLKLISIIAGLFLNFFFIRQFCDSFAEICDPPVVDDDVIVLQSNYFSCHDVKSLRVLSAHVKENDRGNRAVSFVSVIIEGQQIEAVLKEANRFSETRANIYKYNTALREVRILTKLFGSPGIPRLLGSCIEGSRVSYLVERIVGSELCTGNGTTSNCAQASYLFEMVQKSENSILAALKLAYHTARVFKTLEERHYIFEDISGINLMVDKDWQIWIVDVDSFIFYNRSRIFAEMTCEEDSGCYGPVGKFWQKNSLNQKIFDKCDELHGICEKGRCHGFDATLHACGMARWFLCSLSRFFFEFPQLRDEYESSCECISESDPRKRCSFARFYVIMDHLLHQYFETLQSNNR